MKTKVCLKCKKTKSIEEFSPDERRKDGLYARCKSCRVKYCRNYREANREKARESAREWAKRNLGRNGKSLVAWRKRNRFKVALSNSRTSARKHGYAPCTSTVKELEILFIGRCAICAVPEMECTTKLHLDHSHLTGEARGFLCGKCNKALGLFGDNEEILIDAVHYLMSHQHQE